MIPRGDGCQGADKKETDFANTEKDMTRYTPMTKTDLGLKRVHAGDFTEW